jgi:hypothetical protein
MEKGDPMTRATVFRRAGVLAVLLALLTAGLRLGPVLMHATLAATAQTYTWHNAVTGGGGGFVPGIVFNQTRPGLAYARADIGGAYRWNPATGSWVQLLNWVSPDEWNMSGVESIATDPVDPNRLYIAAGTYTNNFTTMNGAILRSTDQGNTFQRTNLPFKLGGNMPGRSMGERLQIDPNQDGIVYFGARSGNGLWRSTDFGVTWSRVTSFTAVATYVEKAGDNYLGDTDGVVWETFDPRTGTPGHATQTIYTGIADKGNSIFRSTDGGATWAPVPGQPTGFLPHHGVLSSTGQLYISYSNGAGPYDGTSGDVWRFDTGAGTWTRVSPVPSTDTANDYFGYGGLSVDTQHPNTIMVAALNSWWPDTIFFRSTNAGATWTRVWDWAGYPNRTLRYAQDISGAPWLNFGVTNPIPPVPSPKLGWMVGALAIDPFNSSHMLYGTGATVYGTNDLTNWDAGTTFHVSVAAAGIEETSVLALISPPAGAHLFSGVGDVGGFRHDDLTKPPATMYTAPTFGTTTSLDFAELTPNFLVRSGNPGSGFNSTGFSFDGGTSWFQGNSQPAGTNDGGSVAAAANASRVVWSPSGAAVSVSTDNGNSWTASTGIPAGAGVRSDRVNPNKFYGFSNGTFYVSTNGGASFTASAASALPVSAKFKAVAGHEGDVWLAGDPGGIFHSTDSGATFTKLANVTFADTIGLGMSAPGQTYPALYTSASIGGVHGLFRSDDAGTTWIRINDDQHQFATTSADITGDPRIYGRVYVTTNGLGIVYGDVNGVVTSPSPSPSPSVSPSASPSSSPGGGGVTVNPVVSSSSPYYDEEDLKLSNTGSLTSLSITIVVQRTTGVSFSGMYNSVGGQILQSNSSTASAITYQFTLASGQTLGAAGGVTFAAQASGNGTAHPTAGDTFTVTYTTGGANFTQSGHF